MPVRLTRSEQAEAVRAKVLDAARQEFLATGFHGASIDRIAASAGFTKGAVYSRFESKAELFLALLEERIEERRRDHGRLADGQHGPAGLTALATRWAEVQERDEDWTLLVLEFRVHAARDAALQERYRQLHARTLDGIATTLASVVDADEARLRHLARVLFALGNGASLEHAVDPEVFPTTTVARFVQALLLAEQVG